MNFDQYKCEYDGKPGLSFSEPDFEEVKPLLVAAFNDGYKYWVAECDSVLKCLFYMNWTAFWPNFQTSLLQMCL